MVIRKVNEINIKVIKTMHNGNGDIEDNYFFTKNNKYYQIVGWDFPSWNSNRVVKSRKEIDKAVNKIVETIN